jgi:cobalamin biosynthesis protein CobT
MATVADAINKQTRDSAVADYESAFRAIVRHVIASDPSIQVRYIKRGAPCADEKRKIIHMLPMNGLTPDELLKARAFYPHETLHVMETASLGKDKPEGALFSILNALEDVRIETSTRPVREYDGLRLIFRDAQEFFNKDIRRQVEDGETAKRPLWESLCAMMFQVRGVVPAWTLTPKAQSYYDAAYETFAEVVKARSTWDCLAIAKRIHAILKDLLAKEPEEPPPPQGDGEGDEGEEGDDEGKKGESKPKSKKGKKPEKKSGEDKKDGEGKSEGSEKPEGEEKSKGSKKSKGDEDGEGEEKDGEGDEESEGEEKPEGSKKGEGSEDEAGDEDDSAEGSGEGDEEGDDDGEAGGGCSEMEDGEDEAGAEAGDEEGEGEGEGSDGEDEDGEGSSAGKGDGEGAEDESAEDSEAGDAKREEKQDYDVKNTGKVERGDGPGKTLEEIEGILDEEAKGKDMYEAIKEELEKAAERSADEYASVTENDEFCVPELGKDDLEQFNQEFKEVNTKAMALARSLEQAIRVLTASKKMAQQPRGKLDARRLAGLIAGIDKKVFWKKQDGMDLDVSVSILVDESGSMDSCMWQVRRLAMLLGEALDAIHVPFEMVGHTSATPGAPYLPEGYDRSIPLKIDIFKTFRESWKQVRARTIHLQPQSQNVDGEALGIVARRIGARREKRRIVFVLSDGQPHSGHGNNRTLADHLRKVAGDARKGGIEVYAFGLGTRQPEAFYGEKHFIHLESIADIGPKFIQEMVNIISQGKLA